MQNFEKIFFLAFCDVSHVNSLYDGGASRVTQRRICEIRRSQMRNLHGKSFSSILVTSTNLPERGTKSNNF